MSTENSAAQFLDPGGFLLSFHFSVFFLGSYCLGFVNKAGFSSVMDFSGFRVFDLVH